MSNFRSDYYQKREADEYAYLSCYDGRGWFYLNGLGAFPLGMVDDYQLKVPVMPTRLGTTDEFELRLRIPLSR